MKKKVLKREMKKKQTFKQQFLAGIQVLVKMPKEKKGRWRKLCLIVLAPTFLVVYTFAIIEMTIGAVRYCILMYDEPLAAIIGTLAVLVGLTLIGVTIWTLTPLWEFSQRKKN